MGVLDREAAKRAAIVLGILIVIEGGIIALYPHVWLGAAFHNAGAATPIGWIAAIAVAVVYCWYGIRGLPAMQPLLLNFSPYKLLGIAIAVPSAIVEEVFFRQSLMNLLAHAGQGVALQIILSALAFGAVHAFWGLRAGPRGALHAMGSTALLGLALGIVFAVSNRVVLPCVVAHFVINAVLEPWLIYAYVLRGRAAGQA